MRGAGFLRDYLLACVLWCAFGASATEVLILSSDRNDNYADASQSAASELVRLGVRRGEIAQLAVSDMGTADLIALQSAKVWVTLGSEALVRALQREGRPPVVSALIPRQGFERVMRLNSSKTAPVVAIYLDQPFGRQLELAHQALPDLKRIGVLWGQESVLQQGTLQAAAQSKSMDVVSSPVVNSATLFSGLKTVLEDAGLLLAVADPQVYNGSTISNILLATYRMRVPMLAFSPAYVKAGALMAVYSTPRQIGLQAGTVAKSVLQGGPMPPSQYPVDFEVSVNEHVARSLGLTLDEAALNERLHRMEKRP